MMGPKPIRISGHYERFIDVSLSQKRTFCYLPARCTGTSCKERQGVMTAAPCRSSPISPDEIKRRIALDATINTTCISWKSAARWAISRAALLEAIRQFAVQNGRRNCLFLHVTLVPYIAASQEMKTKPTQHSVKELLSWEIQPDIIVCRSDRHLPGSSRIKSRCSAMSSGTV